LEHYAAKEVIWLFIWLQISSQVNVTYLKACI